MSARTTLVTLAAVALVALAAQSGCAAETQEDAASDGQSEDELALRRGSVDHAAIVEATTLMLVPAPSDPRKVLEFATVLDPYNEQDPFRIDPTPFRARFAANLASYDAQDGSTDWTAEQSAAWAARMATGNYLVVDTSKPCGDFDDPHTYLEIERAELTGAEHTTCGGRMPNEDALDVTMNFLVRGPAASVDDEDAIHDGVEQATKRSTPDFPYLAELNGF